MIDFGPCYVIEKPSNRSQKRKLAFELRRNLAEFDKVEQAFIKEIFTDNNRDYEYSYNWYNQEWQMLLQWMGANKMFKYTVPNDKYFVNNYYPIENNEYGK